MFSQEHNCEGQNLHIRITCRTRVHLNDNIVEIGVHPYGQAHKTLPLGVHTCGCSSLQCELDKRIRCQPYHAKIVTHSITLFLTSSNGLTTVEGVQLEVGLRRSLEWACSDHPQIQSSFCPLVDRIHLYDVDRVSKE